MCLKKVMPKLIKEHLIALFIASIVRRMLFLDAVIGQVAGHVLEVCTVVGLRGRPQHPFSIQVDIVLVVHQHPAPGNSKLNTSGGT